MEIRKTSHSLLPGALLQNGLDEAIGRYCIAISNSEILKIQYDSGGEIKRFHDNFELALYRIVKQLLDDTTRHTGATHAIVQLTQWDDLLSITIKNNGLFF